LLKVFYGIKSDLMLKMFWLPKCFGFSRNWVNFVQSSGHPAKDPTNYLLGNQQGTENT
jgi:hypothetical protein